MNVSYIALFGYLLYNIGYRSRKVFCEKAGIVITYTDNNVCFEDSKTTEAILLTNKEEIIHSNFDGEKDEYFENYLTQIYQSITAFRNLDALESA